MLGYIIIIFVGLFSMAGGIFDWNWFMENRRARLFVRLFKRTGARIFYILLGLVFVVVGVLAMTGTIDLGA